MGKIKKVLLWTLRTTCNFHCRYCYYKQEERKNTQIKDLTIVNGILDTIHPELVYLSGEPSLYTELPKVIDLIRRKHSKIILSTNGARFTKEYTREVLGLNIDAIFISLDGPDARTHNYARQDFSRVVSGIRNIIELRDEKKMNLQVGISYVIHAKNISQIENTVNFAIRLGVDRFRYQPVVAPKEKDFALDGVKLQSVIRVTGEIFEKYKSRLVFPSLEYRESLKNIILEGRFANHCYAGRYLFYLDENLSLRPCPLQHEWFLGTNNRNAGRKNRNCSKESLLCLPMIDLTRSII